MKNKKFPLTRYLFTLLSLLIITPFLLRCGTENDWQFKSLMLRHPKLMQVVPEPGSVFKKPIELILEFSERLKFTSIGNRSITLLPGNVDADLLTDPEDLIDSITEEEIAQIPLIYELDGDEKTLILRPQGDLPEGMYHLVITPQLTSVAGVPFNQKPGAGPYPFRATYGYGESIKFSPTGNELAPAAPTYGPEPEILMINEILYDGKNSETDGEAFIELYGSPGADISDYEISLINGASGEETDRITLPRGSEIPETGLFIIADLRTNSATTTQVEAFDYLDHFDPQNGPDAVHLFDRKGQLLDAVGYGEGAVEKSAMGHFLWEGSPAPDAGAGNSLSRVDGFDTQNNGIDFLELEVPSPGAM